jgi:hypothetical protein
VWKVMRLTAMTPRMQSWIGLRTRDTVFRRVRPHHFQPSGRRVVHGRWRFDPVRSWRCRLGSIALERVPPGVPVNPSGRAPGWRRRPRPLSYLAFMGARPRPEGAPRPDVGVKRLRTLRSRRGEPWGPVLSDPRRLRRRRVSGYPVRSSPLSPGFPLVGLYNQRPSHPGESRSRRPRSDERERRVGAPAGGPFVAMSPGAPSLRSDPARLHHFLCLRGPAVARSSAHGVFASGEQRGDSRLLRASDGCAPSPFDRDVPA